MSQITHGAIDVYLKGFRFQLWRSRPYFVHADAGLSTRWHPLDSVFQTAAAKEAEKLRKENFSVARAAVLGEGVGHPRLQMRLLEEDGKGTYTYDWLTRRRVQ